MKKSIFIIAVTIMFMAGAIFTGCESSDQKVEDAKINVQNAKQDLKAAQNEAQKTASAEEWKTFKSASETKIKDNEALIAEFKEKMKTSGKKLDAVYAKNIDALEQKNRDMKYKIDAYEKSQSDWESFKREFNHDMDEIGKALKDLTVNNKS